MNTVAFYKDRFDKLQAHSSGETTLLDNIRRNAFTEFSRMGVPTTKHEEWKYTRISSLFTKEYRFPADHIAHDLSENELNRFRLPANELSNELVFVNGFYSASLSTITSSALVVQSLEEASANEYKNLVAANLGHSASYLNDGINALNTAFVHGGVFVYLGEGQQAAHPVYIYNITDARAGNIFAQARSLFYISQRAQVQIVETYCTIGDAESFSNQVMEVVMERDAQVAYYKIQNDTSASNAVSSVHFRQTGKSLLHAVTISLNGGIVRNNLNVIMEAERSEAHLYGLYFQRGHGHIDNHTLVDNVRPNCLSNELYKGILDDDSSGVFNGKIYVRQQAQKTNAYQSNKNILLSPTASVNSKPQLEIFADDVKCSHGCTVGQLDEEAMFYLQSRGIAESTARSLLVRAFAEDILEHIRLQPIRKYVEDLISERLAFEL